MDVLPFSTLCRLIRDLDELQRQGIPQELLLDIAEATAGWPPGEIGPTAIGVLPELQVRAREVAPVLRVTEADCLKALIEVYKEEVPTRQRKAIELIGRAAKEVRRRK